MIKKKSYRVILLVGIFMILIFSYAGFYKKYECTITAPNPKKEVHSIEVLEKYSDCKFRKWSFEAGWADEFVRADKFPFLPYPTNFGLYVHYEHTSSPTYQSYRSNESTSWDEFIYITNYEEVTGSFRLVVQYYDEDEVKIGTPIHFKTYEVEPGEIYYEHVRYPTANDAPAKAISFTRYVEISPFKECQERERINVVPEELNMTSYKTEEMMTGYE